MRCVHQERNELIGITNLQRIVQSAKLDFLDSRPIGAHMNISENFLGQVGVRVDDQDIGRGDMASSVLIECLVPVRVRDDFRSVFPLL